MWMNHWNSFIETLHCPVIKNAFRVCEKPAVHFFLFLSRQKRKSEVSSSTNSTRKLTHLYLWSPQESRDPAPFIPPHCCCCPVADTSASLLCCAHPLVGTVSGGTGNVPRQMAAIPSDDIPRKRSLVALMESYRSQLWRKRGPLDGVALQEGEGDSGIHTYGRMQLKNTAGFYPS